MDNQNREINSTKRLSAALSALETAIVTAKQQVLLRSPADTNTINRLSCYETMVQKQKIVAQQMFSHQRLGNWVEFNRQAELLRGTSHMIQLDIVSIAEGLLRQAKPGNITESVVAH